MERGLGVRNRILYILLVLALFLAIGPCSDSWKPEPVSTGTAEGRR